MDISTRDKIIILKKLRQKIESFILEIRSSDKFSETENRFYELESDVFYYVNRLFADEKYVIDSFGGNFTEILRSHSDIIEKCQIYKDNISKIISSEENFLPALRRRWWNTHGLTFLLIFFTLILTLIALLRG